MKALIAVCALALCAAGPALAQTSVSDLLGREAAPEGKPKSLLEELFLYGYLENSYAVNLRHASPHNVNDLRFYDHDADYSGTRSSCPSRRTRPSATRGASGS